MHKLKDMQKTTREQALAALMKNYSVANLEWHWMSLYQLFGNCRHPSVLAAMRLVVQAKNMKERAVKESLTIERKTGK